MKNKLFVLLLPAILFLSACSHQTYKTEALKKPNRFAIVSVNGSTSGLGMTIEDDIKLLTKVDDLIAKELEKSKNFKMTSSAAVKQSRSYVAIKSEPEGGIFTAKTAQGYKKFDVTNEPEAMKKLMAELKLTGVIQITASYALKSSGFTLSGILPIPIPVSVGSSSGNVFFVIVVFNNANEVIWSDAVEVTTKNSISKVMGISNTAALYPELLDISQEAVRTAMNNLSEHLK